MVAPRCRLKPTFQSCATTIRDRNAAFTLQARRYTNAVVITLRLQAKACVPIACRHASRPERSLQAAGEALHQCPAVAEAPGRVDSVHAAAARHCSGHCFTLIWRSIMPEIVLATLNAKYIHAAFGLRCLLANLGPCRPRAALLEFDINQRPLEIAEAILAQSPKVLGLGVYIWNATATNELVKILKRIEPELIVILGGPEVSYETDEQEITRAADYVITGEADLKFAQVCQEILDGNRPETRIIPADLPDLAQVELPYHLYTPDDLAHRIIYVEASRGCPFTCEFCLSSLDIPVRQFPTAKLLESFERLLALGVRQFKFVDRTFNLNLNVSIAILDFFWQRRRPDLFLHFEMIPDRLPEQLRASIARFPPGALQFEVGIQTFNETVAALISRRQNYARLEENFRFLRRETGVYIHADLIAGLPGEDLESFARGFDRLIGLGPHEIQVGILKRLRGTPIIRHDREWEMVYSPMPPYEILKTKLINFATMQKLRRFARQWDLVGNSGNFLETTPLIWAGKSSAFSGFLEWSEWLHHRMGRTHAIALERLSESLFEYLRKVLGQSAEEVSAKLWRDYQRGGRTEPPPFLRPHLSKETLAAAALQRKIGLKRQTRRLAFFPS